MGQLYTIFSSKGGVGKTFIAANLAADICTVTPKNVLLVDGGLPSSSGIPWLLRLSKTKGIEKILASDSPIHSDLIESYVKSQIRIFSSKLSLLFFVGENGLLPLCNVSVSNLERVISILISLFDMIIIDIGTKYDPTLRKLFELSAAIFIPVCSDYLSIQSAKEDIRLLRSQHITTELIKIIVNMTGKSGNGTDISSVENQLDKKAFASIPYDPDSETKLFQGLYPLKHPREKITSQISKLTYTLVEGFEHVPYTRTQELENRETNADWNLFKLSVLDKLVELDFIRRLELDENQTEEEYEQIQRQVTDKIIEIIDKENFVKSSSARERLTREVLQEALGYGPIDDLIYDPSVSEIMVNGSDTIYIERNGLIELTDRKFLSEKHLVRIINKIIKPLGRKIDSSTPTVDGRLRNGSRIHAIIPPLALNGPTLTIRKFMEKRMEVDDLIERGALNPQIAQFLKAAVITKLNILISGGTGTGKTTLLNILSGYIPSKERIITVEDSAELQLRQPHVISLEARPKNIEGTGEITIRDLVKNTLRMRPDRIVVGECRGAEALDMLQAMNTGHDGSMTTIHANSAKEALSRLETLVMFGGAELPSRAVKEQIIGAIHLIVQLKRFRTGERKIIQVSEVLSLKDQEIRLKDIFRYKQTGEDKDKIIGDFISTGYIPQCIDRFKENNIIMPREIFWSSEELSQERENK